MCTSFCKTYPGFLIPSDVGPVLEAAQAKPEEVLVASEGSLVIYRGEMQRLGTILPAHKPDGSCVFLDENDRCKIHAAAPYGCAYTDFHMSDLEGRSVSAAGLQTLMEPSPELQEYRKIREQLQSAGKVAQPLAVRRQAMLELQASILARRET